MMYDSNTDEYVLSTGRRFYSFSTTLGIDDSHSEISYGHDGGVSEQDEFTVLERIEIAGEMCRRWMLWALKV